MPARLRQAKSDTYVPEPVGFAIPEAKMRVLRTVILTVRFLFAVRRGEECRTQGTCPLCALLQAEHVRLRKPNDVCRCVFHRAGEGFADPPPPHLKNSGRTAFLIRKI